MLLSIPAIAEWMRATWTEPSRDLAEQALPLFIVAIVGFHTLSGCRPAPMGFATVGSTAMYLAVVALQWPDRVGFAAFWMVIANGMGMFGSYVIEMYRRRGFTQRRLIELELRR
jgi:hypothetical protein